MERLPIRMVLVSALLGLFGATAALGHAQPPACSVTLSPDQSIQDAVDDARRGDVICLESGTWTENVEIRRSLTLRGIGDERSTIRGTGEGTSQSAVFVRGSAREVRVVSLRNLELLGTATGTATGNAIQVAGSSLTQSASLILQNVRAAEAATGVRVAGPDVAARIRDSVIEDNESRGVFADRGVELRVVNTLIANNGVSGLGLRQGSRAIVQGSTIRDHAVEDFGIGTVIQAAGIGINVGSGSRLRLVNSIVRHNGVSGAENPMMNTGIITEFLALPAPVSQPGSGDAASVELIDSRLDGNAQGVLLGQQTDLLMTGTFIRDSQGWGLAGLAGPCMTVGLFERTERMTGRLQFRGGNLIEDNNDSGKLDGQGNPGAHPFHYLPDGQVCLPR